MKRYAIIVAGGSGTRMQGTLPKQFLALGGRPVLMHTLEKFHRPGIDIILVLNKAWHQYWKEQCLANEFHIPHDLVDGGNTRAESVRNGMKNIGNGALVAVHDAVRPFISPNFLLRLYEEAAQFGSAIPVLPVKETLRHLQKDGSVTVSRDEYRIVQTPQVFQSEILIKAFLNPEYSSFTDEASLADSTDCGPLHLTAGEETNIKLTVPADLFHAEWLLSRS